MLTNEVVSFEWPGPGLHIYKHIYFQVGMVAVNVIGDEVRRPLEDVDDLVSPFVLYAHAENSRNNILAGIISKV